MIVPLTALLLGAAPVSYEARLRTEVRGSPQGDGEVQLNPGIELKIPVDHLTLSTGYAPRLVFFEVGSGRVLSLLHNGHVTADQRVGKRGRLYLDQQIAYGRESFSWLASAAEGGIGIVDRLATLPPVTDFRSTTTLGLEQALSKSVGLGVAASYFVGGGTDQASRATLPWSRSVRASVTFAWALGLHDFLLTQTGGQLTFFSSVQRSYYLDLAAGWRHLFSENSDLDLLVGASGGRDVSPDVVEDRFYPYFQGTIRRKFVPGKRQTLTGILSLRVEPGIDPINGNLYPRATAEGSLAYSPVSKLTLTAAAGGAKALNGGQRGQNVGYGGLAAAYELRHDIILNAGVRLVAVPNVLYVGFLAITFTERGHF